MTLNDLHDNNYKYLKVGEIVSRVTSRLKGFNKNVAEVDIIEWCMQVENEFCVNVDNMYIYTHVPLTVINNTAKVPCNVFRIADVYTSHSNHGQGNRVPYQDLGSVLAFNPHHKVTIPYIDYWGSPIDLETGEPLIQRGHENACEWYCVYNLLFVDAATGKITADFWHNTVERNKENEISAAQCSSVQFKSRDQLNQEMRITFDEMPEPAKLWLLSSEVKHHVRHVTP